MGRYLTPADLVNIHTQDSGKTGTKKNSSKKSYSFFFQCKVQYQLWMC